jgi:GntR family transcriptional regulator, arabinose operon transcriptional repressor
LQLLDKEVGGVAIVPTVDPPTPAYQPGQLQKRGIPVVFCHRRVNGVEAPLLALPYHDVGHKAGSALAAKGHRRVAFVTSHNAPSMEAYQAGLQEALTAQGGVLPAEFVFRSGSLNQEDELLSGLRRMFSHPNPPTAIFTTFDSQAETIYFLLPRLGLRVPEDVSLVGFGGAWREGVLLRRLTSVVIDEVATGRKAVSLLHEMRHGQRAIDDNEEFVLQLELCEGETLAAPGSNIGRN